MNIPQVRGPIRIGPVNLPKGADTTYSPHEGSALGQLLLQIPQLAKGIEQIRQKKAQQSMIEELLSGGGGSSLEGTRGGASAPIMGADIRAQRERESQQPFLQRMLGGLFDPSRAPQSTPLETQAAEGILKSRLKGNKIGDTRAGINPETGEKITEVFTKEGWQAAKEKGLKTTDYKRIWNLAEEMARSREGLTTFESVPNKTVEKYIPVAEKYLSGEGFQDIGEPRAGVTQNQGIQQPRTTIMIDRNGKKAEVEVDKNGKPIRVIRELR
jgi:hypothetical protein